MEEKPQVIYKIRKSTGKTVTIVILILLLVVLLGYILYTNYNEILTKKETPKVSERTEMYYSEVNTILDQIRLYNEVFKESYPIADVNKIDNQLKLQFGILALEKTENIHNYYKVDDLKEMYYNYFSHSMKVIYEDIKCPVNDKNLYDLNTETNTYTEVSDHEHGMITMNADTYVTSTKIEDGKYIINTHILYSSYCNGTCSPEGGYYKTYEDCVKSNNPVIFKTSQYDEVKDDLPVTTFTFLKEKNHFLLESVEIKD